MTKSCRLVYFLALYSLINTFVLLMLYKQKLANDLMYTPRIFSKAYSSFTSRSNSLISQLSDSVVQGVSPNILCWIVTAPFNHKSKAITVKQTWGKRCDTFLFVSSQNDSELPTVVVMNGTEGREKLWHKAQATFKLIYGHYLDKADWFLKADDDTYVIIENLKFLLKDFDTNEPLFFGQLMKPNVNTSYMAGGAGYVLSKEAMKRLVEKALPGNYTNCPKDVATSEDDVFLSHCLAAVNVTFVDTTDNLERERFNQERFQNLLLGNVANWYPSYISHPYRPGFNCCSEAVISFHYLTTTQMQILEFFIYHVKVFGLSSNWNDIDLVEKS